jgi:glycosyltransferase 2 family protein
LKILLNVFLYVSFISVVVYLYLNELFVLPEFNKAGWFVVSIAFLLIGYSLDVKAWQEIVKVKIKYVSYEHAFISTGKYIFSKYMPGKLWVIAGRAAYLKEIHNDDLIGLVSISFYYQIISIVAGTLVGFGILYLIDLKWFWIIATTLILFLILLSYYYNSAIRTTSRLFSFILKKEIRLPIIPQKTSLKIIIISILNWMMWSIAFYLLLISIHDISIVPIKAGLLFPISTVFGIVVVIAPGGLGIREGFLTLGLTALSLPSNDAASIAILSRLWFLIGELLVFVVALLSHIYFK